MLSLSSTSLLPSLLLEGLDGHCLKTIFFTRLNTAMQFNTSVLCLLSLLVALLSHGIPFASVRLSSNLISIVSFTMHASYTTGIRRFAISWFFAVCQLMANRVFAVSFGKADGKERTHGNN